MVVEQSTTQVSVVLLRDSPCLSTRSTDSVGGPPLEQLTKQPELIGDTLHAAYEARGDRARILQHLAAHDQQALVPPPRFRVVSIGSSCPDKGPDSLGFEPSSRCWQDVLEQLGLVDDHALTLA